MNIASIHSQAESVQPYTFESDDFYDILPFENDCKTTSKYCHLHDQSMQNPTQTRYLCEHPHPHEHDVCHLHSTENEKDITRSRDLVQLQLVREDHGNHHHDLWRAQSSADKLRDAVKWTINQDQEGCPCCVAGLDFDEFAVAIKELKNADGSKSEQIAQLADFNDAGHWGIFLGVSAPLGLIGLTAAIRNVKGSSSNLSALKKIVIGLNQDIARLKATQNGTEHREDIQKLTAFRDTLQYSKFDSKFNVLFPGFVNGAASSLVLSTAIVSHPFALPAIALYATGQLARNTYDFNRNMNRHMQFHPQDSSEILQAKQKVNQVHQSKQKFYLGNSTGFAAFAVGATLTFLSIPALSIGIGAVGLPLGLALLSAGALSTGIMNNIWPRKFRPRNGDLGIDRSQLNGDKECLQEIQRRREHKKIIASFGSGILTHSIWKKRFLKVLTAMPEFKDFMPASVAKVLDRFIPILKKCGTAATAKKHRLNFEIIGRAYAHNHNIEALDARRVVALRQMAKAETNSQAPVTDPLARSWALLGQLNLQAPVLDIYLNETFKPKAASACGHDHQNHTHEHAHEHEHEHNHVHEHCSPCGHGSHGASGQSKGVHLVSETEAEFDFDDFMHHATVKDKNKLKASMDYYLYFVHRKQMQYQQYGLIDYMWSLSNAKNQDAHNDHLQLKKQHIENKLLLA